MQLLFENHFLSRLKSTPRDCQSFLDNWLRMRTDLFGRRRRTRLSKGAGRGKGKGVCKNQSLVNMVAEVVCRFLTKKRMVGWRRTIYHSILVGRTMALMGGMGLRYWGKQKGPGTVISPEDLAKGPSTQSWKHRKSYQDFNLLCLSGPWGHCQVHRKHHLNVILSLNLTPYCTICDNVDAVTCFFQFLFAAPQLRLCNFSSEKWNLPCDSIDESFTKISAQSKVAIAIPQIQNWWRLLILH